MTCTCLLYLTRIQKGSYRAQSSQRQSLQWCFRNQNRFWAFKLSAADIRYQTYYFGLVRHCDAIAVNATDPIGQYGLFRALCFPLRNICNNKKRKEKNHPKTARAKLPVHFICRVILTHEEMVKSYPKQNGNVGRENTARENNQEIREGIPGMVYALLNTCQLVQENTTSILHRYLSPGVSPACFTGVKTIQLER